MGVVLMHLSDLHRSSGDPISNEELLAALISDRKRHTQEVPGVGTIDAIVVSGDLVQGVPIGSKGYESELDKQYAEAEDFLRRLADEFLGGNRGAIVVSPGNHDVDWNAALGAMSECDPAAEKIKLPRDLFREKGPYRWDWGQRRLMKISDPGAYGKRLDAYRSMVERLYDTPTRANSGPVGEGWRAHTIGNGRIAIFSFESVEGNDCFRSWGKISPKAIATATLALDKMNPIPDLAIGVWHHHVHGPPQQDDYLDTAAIFQLISGGFRLGLHGHQHQSAASPVAQMGSEETMALISAGSLCAGARELPTGARRQYNIIEIRDDCSRAVVHVRHMREGQMFGPGMLGVSGRSSMEIRWTKAPPRLVNSTREPSPILTQIEKAEQAMAAGDSLQARQIVGSLDRNLPIVRNLLIQILRELDDASGLLEVVVPPKSAEECVVAVNAATALGKFAAAEEVLEVAKREQLLDPATINELKGRIDIKKRLKA